MRVVLSCLLILLCAHTAALGQSMANDSRQITAERALQLEKQWDDDVAHADIPALERLLADDLTHIHGTGAVETKTQFIAALKSGDRKYDPIVPEEVSVHVFDGCAVVTGRFHLKAFSKGRIIEGDNRFAHVFAETPQGWQLVLHQATNIPDGAK